MTARARRRWSASLPAGGGQLLPQDQTDRGNLPQPRTFMAGPSRHWPAVAFHFRSAEEATTWLQ